MTDEYTNALIAHNAAYAAFDAVRTQYRARAVGDAAFLAAKAEYASATDAFDLAFAKEAETAS